ncbi:hypothetical protein DY000_02009149 [Brassica cretica]|uniref:Uncharacterized protein n=1 Tax=Brassica cretica TaxID=69181 RepID=A0ABQ7BXA1_BRACR|nr:hypothetical protein DY000_02009149 [Brassica cretica]
MARSQLETSDRLSSIPRHDLSQLAIEDSIPLATTACFPLDDLSLFAYQSQRSARGSSSHWRSIQPYLRLRSHDDQTRPRQRRGRGVTGSQSRDSSHFQDSPSPHSSYHTSPSAAPASAPLAPAAAPAPAPPGPPGVMSVAELVRQSGRDHLPYLTSFNRSGNGISAWINRMMYSALDRGTSDFHSLPYRQAASVVSSVCEYTEGPLFLGIFRGFISSEFSDENSEEHFVGTSKVNSEDVLPRYIPRRFPTNWWSSEFPRKFISSEFRRKIPRDFRGKWNFRRVISEDLFRRATQDDKPVYKLQNLLINKAKTTSPSWKEGM